MRRPAYLLPLAIFAVLGAYFHFSLEEGPGSLPSPLIGRQPPAFAVKGLASTDIRGPALVNLFASWCAPCRAEHPILMRLAKEEGLRIYGIAYKDKPKDAARFLAELGNPFVRVGHDPDGRAAIEWGVTGVPETFAINRAGIVAFKHAGPLTAEIVESDLRPALAR